MVDVERAGSIAGRARKNRRTRGTTSASHGVDPAEARAEAAVVVAEPIQIAAPETPPRPQRPSLPTLDPGATARSAATILLVTFGDTVDLVVEQILAGDEPEAVHDLRIALRRTRCLIGPLRGVFTRRESDLLRRGLRWLADISGPAR